MRQTSSCMYNTYIRYKEGEPELKAMDEITSPSEKHLVDITSYWSKVPPRKQVDVNVYACTALIYTHVCTLACTFEYVSTDAFSSSHRKGYFCAQVSVDFLTSSCICNHTDKPLWIQQNGLQSNYFYMQTRVSQFFIHL